MLQPRFLVVLLALFLLPAIAGAAGGVPTFVTGDLGRLEAADATVAAAQDALQDILADRFSAVGDEEMEVVRSRTDAQGDTYVRFRQSYRGLPVVGAELYLRHDRDGRVVSVNGDFVPSSKLPAAPKLGAEKAVANALLAAGLGAAQPLTRPELTYVVTGDGAALAWALTVAYVNDLGPQRDVVFADALTGEVAAIHPQHFYARSLLTYDCNNGTSCNSLASSSPNPINTGDDAIDAAHNYAIATYDYYFDNHGRDSINDAGMTLRSRVHYSNNYNNAFWDGTQMTYGDGDGTTFIPLSQDADVVAHELTHGVTENESGLIYSYESGALNEALSDIFGAGVDRQEGANVTDTWLLGEDIYTPNIPGDALRVMNDPQAAGDYDYYPTRYTGSQDNGGVHWNSGIANLAFVLLVEGGTHPRGATSNNVPALAANFDTSLGMALDIFYYANTSCMTPSSNFEAARNCTAAGALALYGATAEAAVHEAWDAVGVPGGGGPPPGGGCPAGHTEYTSTIAAGNPDQVTANFNASGTLHGLLLCSGADLDLYLDRMNNNGSFRNTVASSTSAGCNEEITYSNSRNRKYRWRVRAYSGSASFTLCVDPG